jgi:hypothetical protein
MKIKELSERNDIIELNDFIKKIKDEWKIL